MTGEGQYRKRPVVVEAYQMTPMGSDAHWPSWLKHAWDLPRDEPGSLQTTLVGNAPTSEFEIVTLEGTHRVSWDDWIIQGVEGELYPCKPRIFEATYESASLPVECKRCKERALMAGAISPDEY